mmetsp:Transcript_30831/g.42709  ORF Transcript_30831/g.42709 Transcript_30831/m.42709 type:complete len:213 (-) Transcript_30831:98-736(-)
MNPPTMRITVSNTLASYGLFRLNSVATQSRALPNSSLRSMIQSVSSESMMVAPSPANRFLPRRELGCSSSMPHANLSYPFQACFMAAFTASRRCTSASALTQPERLMSSAARFCMPPMSFSAERSNCRELAFSSLSLRARASFSASFASRTVSFARMACCFASCSISAFLRCIGTLSAEDICSSSDDSRDSLCFSRRKKKVKHAITTKGSSR